MSIRLGQLPQRHALDRRKNLSMEHRVPKKDGCARGSLYVIADTGAGKTTLVQQLCLHLLRNERGFLEQPVADVDRVGYIAADRPMQAMRSLERMTTLQELEELQDRFVIHKGPIPDDFAALSTISQVAEAVLTSGVDIVVFDSLKDFASDLSNEETGGRLNRLFQILCTRGVDVVVLHHLRKATSTGKSRRDISSMYGSMYFASGAGSVLLLERMKSEHLRLTQLKSPADAISPMTVELHRETGRLRVLHAVDPVRVVLNQHRPMTLMEVASVALGTSDPSKSESQAIRRKLNRACAHGHLERTGGGRDGVTGQQRPDEWMAPR